MSRATQALHASAERWLPKNARQQLYWVLLVSCVLLLGIQTSKWLQRRPEVSPAPVAAGTTEATASASVTDDPGIVNATVPDGAEDNNDVVIVDTVAVAVADSSADTTIARHDAEQAVTTSEPTRPLEQPVKAATDEEIVARVFAALASPGPTKVTKLASPSVDVPADLPDFFAALARYTKPSQDSPAERQKRLRGIEYLFTLHAPPASPEVAEFFARQLAQHKHESSQDVVQAPATSDAPSTDVATGGSEVPSPATPNPVTIAEADAEQADAAAIPREPSADLAAHADTVATAQENPQELPVAELVLVNPVETGGTILYLVEGQAFSLAPGQSHRLPAERPWRVAFHRGDDFGDTEMLLTTGEFNFAVGSQGWELVPADGR